MGTPGSGCQQQQCEHSVEQRSGCRSDATDRPWPCRRHSAHGVIEAPPLSTWSCSACRCHQRSSHACELKDTLHAYIGLSSSLCAASIARAITKVSSMMYHVSPVSFLVSRAERRGVCTARVRVRGDQHVRSCSQAAFFLSRGCACRARPSVKRESETVFPALQDSPRSQHLRRRF